MAKSCLLFPLLTLLNLPDIWCFRNSRMSFFPVLLWPYLKNPRGVSFALSFKLSSPRPLFLVFSLLSPWHTFNYFQGFNSYLSINSTMLSSIPDFSAVELTDFFSSPHPKVVSPPIFPCPVSSAQWITVYPSGPGDAGPRWALKQRYIS